MELKHIKELMAVMQRTGTKRLVIKREGVELELERESRSCQQPSSDSSQQAAEESALRHEIALHRSNILLTGQKELVADRLSHSISDAKMSPSSPDANSLYATSPMVGTFFSASSPDDPPFIKVGDRVEKNTIIGIIEAMKVMNEIKSGVTGIVAEILVKNGHPVEFGSRLCRVTPLE